MILFHIITLSTYDMSHPVYALFGKLRPFLIGLNVLKPVTEYVGVWKPQLICINCISIKALSLANLVLELGTRHSHQILLTWSQQWYRQWLGAERATNLSLTQCCIYALPSLNKLTPANHLITARRVRTRHETRKTPAPAVLSITFDFTTMLWFKNIMTILSGVTYVRVSCWQFHTINVVITIDV